MSAISKAQKSCKAGYYYCYTDKKCKKIPMGYYVGRGGYISKDDDSSEETKKKNGNGNGNGNGSNGNGGGNGNGNGGSGGVSEEKTFAQRDKIMKKAKSLHKHLYKNLHKKDTSGDVNERIDYADSKQMKKYADEKKKHKEQDKRMKFGKFVKRAEEARDRLRPGEVKRYDKTKGKWVSNKD